jgi:hypothetical protein
VALPKTATKRRSHSTSELLNFISHTLDKERTRPESITPSGTAFFAVLFSTAEKRERAKGKLDKSVFTVDGVVVKLSIFNFGEKVDKGGPPACVVD